MKKIFYSILLLSSMLLAGCTAESLRADREDKDCIVLYFSGAGNQALDMTKSTPEPGVSNYNENLITSVDCFFYPEDGTDSPAVMIATGRVAERVAGSQTLYKVTIRYTSAQAMSIFRSETDGTGRVFVIANATLNYDPDSTSVANLKNKLVERDFSAQVKQGSFVMFSEDDEDSSEGYPITMSEGIVSGRIPMDRVAAKAQLFLKIPKFLPGVNAGEIWRPDTTNMKIYLANGVKRGRIKGPYSPAADGSDYFNFDNRALYNLIGSVDPDDIAAYDEVKAINDSSWMYRFTSLPFYSYPCTWKDIHEHATQYIIDIPWFVEGSGVAPSSRFYQVSANTMSSTFESNHYYRTYAEIRSLGGVDEEQAVTIPECNYIITPWIRAGVDADGYPVVGEFEMQSYLVVEPTRVILNNENYTDFDYLSSTALRADSTRVIKVSYYNYKTQTAPIVRTEHTATKLSQDANTNSTAIQVSIDEAGKVRVTHNLYNNDGSQKIFVEYEIVVRIYNNDGLFEDVTIIQRPPLYVLMKDGDNAFVDGYFRHVRKTGGGTPFANAWAHTATQWAGYYRSVSYYVNPNTTTKDNYWYLGTTDNTQNTYRAYYGMVNTPYGNMYSTPTSTDLSLYDITGVKLSAFSDSYHTYTVGVGTNGSGAVDETFEYRIGDPRVDNDFTGSPKLVDYLTGMGDTYTNNNPGTGVRRYNSSNVYTAAWGSLADKVKMATEDHNENTLIAPYILVSSSYLSQASSYGVTFEQAQKRCATYQEGGYPAGRWRLPTEAEIMFIIERQNDNSINTLFNTSTTSSYYWAASGYYLSGGKLYANTDNTRKGAARCVYDAWYWGDEPVAEAAYTYKPMP